MVTSSDSGSEAMAGINAALLDVGSEVVVGNESGSSVATKLNGVFGSAVVTDQQSGSAFAQAVDDAFDAMEGGGDTPTPPTPDDGHTKLRFLHISDLHGTTTGLSQCADMLDADNGISHLIISGDMSPYEKHDGGSYSEYNIGTLQLLERIKAMGDRILVTAGNHDSYENDHNNLWTIDMYGDGSQLGFSDIETPKQTYIRDKEKQFQRAVMCRHENGSLVRNVNWGLDNVNRGTWWYKDIVAGSGTENETTMRVIGLDDYDGGVGKNIASYSPEQVTWLLNLLANTPSSYYLLIIVHDPPCKSLGSGVAATMCPAAGDSQSVLAQKLFVSELHHDFHERGSEAYYNLLPTILKAYMHQEYLDLSTVSNNVLSNTKDFTNVEPATFVGWVFGHIHRDVIGYIPSEDFADQLLICVAAGDSSVVYATEDDMLYNYGQSAASGGTQWASSEPTYRINELIFDFTAGTLTVKRHGNKTTANVSGRSYGGRVRDEVTFNLRKENDND